MWTRKTFLISKRKSGRKNIALKTNQNEPKTKTEMKAYWTIRSLTLVHSKVVWVLWIWVKESHITDHPHVTHSLVTQYIPLPPLGQWTALSWFFTSSLHLFLITSALSISNFLFDEHNLTKKKVNWWGSTKYFNEHLLSALPNLF